MRLREMHEGKKVFDADYEKWGVGKIISVDKSIGKVAVKYNGNKCRMGSPRGKVTYNTSYDFRYLKQA